MREQTLRRQAALTAAGTALVRGMGFVLRLWLSRLLGAEALGIMELASGAHMLALTPAAAGLPGAVSRLTAKAKTRAQRQLTLYAGRRLALWMGLIGTPLFFLLSPWLAAALGDARALPALWLFAPCVLTVGLSSVYDGYYFGLGRPLPPALSELAEQAVRMAVIAALSGLVPLVTAAYRAALPAFASTLGEAAGLLVILCMADAVPSYRKDHRLKSVQRELARLSLPLLLNRLCHTGLRALCSAVIPLRLMAGGLERAEAVSRLGMFSGMVMPLMFLPGMLAGALATVGGPAVARRQGTAGEGRLIRRLLLCAFAAGGACALGLYALAPVIARHFYRLPELTGLIRSSCPLALILPLQQVSGGLMTGLGLQRRSLRASLIGSALLLLLTWLWTPALGIRGAAYASMAGHGVTLLGEMVSLLTKRSAP